METKNKEKEDALKKADEDKTKRDTENSNLMNRNTKLDNDLKDAQSNLAVMNQKCKEFQEVSA